MPIPGPGTAISMTTIATEFGGTVPHSLSEYYRGGGLVPNTPTNAAIPTSGTIAIGNFYGAANRNTVNLTIAANTTNYDVYTNRGPAYVAGSTDLVVTVNPGVIVGSATTGTYAMLVPSAFSPTDTVTIVNNNVIQGRGGNGGAGGPALSPAIGAPGGVGGNAIYVNRPTTITNNGTVAGGGGGGGGGGPPTNKVAGGPGGGGAGFPGGAPNGTSAAGGAGIAPGGGPGGGRGAAGSAGAAGRGVGGSGGGAGNYIVGNPFTTWPVTGTRQGGVA